MEYNYEKIRLSREYTKLLNKYFSERTMFVDACRDYERAKMNYRNFAKAENQHLLLVEAKCLLDNSGILSKEEYIKYYNKKLVPLTRMPFSEIQKINAAKCKETKERKRVHQHCMNTAFVKLKEFLSYNGFKG